MAGMTELLEITSLGEIDLLIVIWLIIGYHSLAYER
jgi:hypothetical protein